MQLFVVHIIDEHFADIIQFLSRGTTPIGYTTQQKKELVARDVDFSIIAGNLYKMGSNGVLRRYVLDYKRQSILTEAHRGFSRGSYAGRATVQKMLRVGYGGQLCTRILRNIVGRAMYINGSGSHREGMNCL